MGCKFLGSGADGNARCASPPQHPKRSCSHRSARARSEEVAEDGRQSCGERANRSSYGHIRVYSGEVGKQRIYRIGGDWRGLEAFQTEFVNISGSTFLANTALVDAIAFGTAGLACACNAEHE